MKRLHFFLFVAFTACLFAGCRKPVEVSFGVQSLNIAAEGGDYTVELKSNGDWSIGSTADWLAVSPTSGNGDAILKFAARPNPTEQRRSVELSATTKDNSASLTISQEGAPNGEDPNGEDPNGEDPGGEDVEHFLTVTPNELQFVCTGENKVITIECDEAWSITNETDWIGFDKTEGDGNDEVVVTVGENPLHEMRSAEIEIRSASGNSAVINASQEASPIQHFLNVSPKVLPFGKEGGSMDVTIECDAEWQVLFEADWLSVSLNEGTGNGTVTFSALPNVFTEPRETVVTINSHPLTQTIVVRQAPGDEPIWANVTPDSLFVPRAGGVRSISITSNHTWTLTVPSWITMPVTSGTGDATLEMMVDVNVSNSPRIGSITIQHGIEVLATVAVVQEGITSILTTDVTEINLPAEGGVGIIRLTANQSWWIRNPVSWVECTPMNGAGDMEISVKAIPLETEEPRETVITIRGDLDAVTTVTVRQSR
jgi:hypothetical protein